jgi:nucleoside-diphosphate-sugar epimerase
VRQLVERGDAVRTFSRSLYPALESLGVEQVQGDLEDADGVMGAVRGCEIVFHAAAKTGVWGTYYEYYEPNVVGTQNVIEACQQLRVQRLVYTSTPAVAFRGEDQEGIDASGPLPEHFLCHYARTKATAEQIVRQANRETIYTVALRPHLIWGPGDTQLVPRIVERAKAGKLRLVGDGSKLVDIVYIDNAARAHLQAADALGPKAPCAGKAYYITNGEPWPMKKIVNRILDAAGLPPVERSISPGMAFALGWLLEMGYTVAGKRHEPPMTRFVAKQLSTAHWYDIAPAQRDFGYAPTVTLDEGLQRLKESLNP